jgi:hypothetical protein
MPGLFGIGIHILVALFFAVHVVRTGRELYWLLILFMFPLLGSVVYFLVVFMPEMQSNRGVRQAGAAVARTLNPGRNLREARAAFDLTPTAQNQMRLAAALLDAGQTADAVSHYDACLAGPFAQDPEINLGAARAKRVHGDAAAAIGLLAGLRARSPGFRAEQVGLMLAKAHAAAGMHAQAGDEFAELVQRFASVEVRAEYALWAVAQGRRTIAHEQVQELAHARRHMARHTKQLYADLFRRLDAACAGM